MGSAFSTAFAQIEWQPFPLSVNEDYKERIHFGYLTVPENYEFPDGRSIRIAFAIVRPDSAVSRPDAVIYFEGGWGIPALQNLNRLIGALDAGNRDLIFFDSRGIGLSEPDMCTDLGEGVFRDLKDDLNRTDMYENQLLRFNHCLDLLVAEGIDYDQYGHNNSSRDALTLAENLGYDAYNLLGISNGTRHIQNFIRAAEGSSIRIRSAILDSAVPMGIPKQGLMTHTYARTLNMLFDDCEASPQCSGTYPNLRSRFMTFINELDEQPLVITLAGEHEPFIVNKIELNAIIHQLLYQDAFYEVFPIFVNDLVQGNTRLLELLLPLLENLLLTSYGSFTGFVQYAYNDKVFNRESVEIYNQSVQENPGLEVWDGQYIFLEQENWLRTDSLEAVPVESDIPALITAGSYDPITPPEWSELLYSRFENAFYIEFTSHGHGVIPSPCGLQLLEQFLDNPRVKPDPECLEQKLNARVEFISDYYENPRMGDIALAVIGKPNIILGATLLLIITICLINVIRSLMALFKPQKAFPVLIFTCSLLILALLTGVAISFLATVDQNFFLIASGLVSSANTWFYLSPLLLLLITAFLFTLTKPENRSPWSMITFAAFVTFAVLIVTFRLFPNL